MSPQEFDELMLKIEDCYGSKHYPAERKRLIFNNLSYLSADEFRRVVERIIADERNPPLLPQFKEYVNAVLGNIREERNKRINEIIEKMPNCRYCGKEGMIFGRDRKTGYSCVHRCGFCQVANQKGDLFMCMELNYNNAARREITHEIEWAYAFYSDEKAESHFMSTPNEKRTMEEFKKLIPKNFVRTIDEALKDD